MTMATRNK